MDFGLTLKAILDNSLESIVFISPEHKVIAFNKTISDLLFRIMDKQIQIGDDYRDYVIPNTKEVYNDFFQKALNGETNSIQYQAVKDNLSIWFEFNMTPVYSEEKSFLGVTLTAKNIDSYKKAEIELEQIAETDDAIFENTTETIVLMDKDLKVLRYNKAAAESIKRQRNMRAYIGADFSNYIAKDSLPGFLQIFNKALRGESTFTEINSFDHNGIPYWFQIKMQPVYKKNGELLGVSLFTFNISEKKQVEQSLDLSVNKLREVAWNQAHIIRTPVSKILGIVNIIKYYQHLDESEKKEWLSQLETATNELDTVIKNIINLTGFTNPEEKE